MRKKKNSEFSSQNSEAKNTSHLTPALSPIMAEREKNTKAGVSSQNSEYKKLLHHRGAESTEVKRFYFSPEVAKNKCRLHFFNILCDSSAAGGAMLFSNNQPPHPCPLPHHGGEGGNTSTKNGQSHRSAPTGERVYRHMTLRDNPHNILKGKTKKMSPPAQLLLQCFCQYSNS